MTAVFYLILTVQMMSAVLMTGLILLQHGKGADAGASFGGGGSGSLFGAKGGATVLSRATSALAAVFFATTLGLAYVSDLEVKSAVPAAALLPAAAATTGAPSAVDTVPATTQGASHANQ